MRLGSEGMPDTNEATTSAAASVRSLFAGPRADDESEAGDSQRHDRAARSGAVSDNLYGEQ